MTVITVRCADTPTLPGSGEGVVLVEELCRHPKAMIDAVAGADGVVVHLHPDQAALADVQTALRRGGVDPMGAQILETDESTGAAQVDLAVAALVARAEAFAGASAEQIKPVIAHKVTRRGLLRPPVPEYVATPSIDHAQCRAVDGCNACVLACPVEAYRRVQGRIIYDKDACQPCGICVTTCPVGAVSNPAATPRMLADQIAGLVEGSTGPPSVRFVCAGRTDRQLRTGWFDVEVPCTGMVTGAMVVAAVTMGAEAVAVPACDELGCPRDLADRSRPAVGFASVALRAAGHQVETGDRQVRIGAPLKCAPISPFDREGAVETMLALFAGIGGEGFASRNAPLAEVKVNSSACTLCVQCAGTCPTGALMSRYKGDEVALSFDPMLCANCGQCMTACPEALQGAISVRGGYFPDLIAAGRTVLNEGTVLTCERCGSAIAPSKMMDRLGAILGDEFAGTMEHLTRRCLDCRGI